MPSGINGDNRQTGKTLEGRMIGVAVDTTGAVVAKVGVIRTEVDEACALGGRADGDNNDSLDAIGAVDVAKVGLGDKIVGKAEDKTAESTVAEGRTPTACTCLLAVGVTTTVIVTSVVEDAHGTAGLSIPN